MNKTLRILGKRGRITIPFEMRTEMGFTGGDVVSFEKQSDREVLVRREKLCTGCAEPKPEKDETITLLDFLDQLPVTEQRAALIHLSVKWAADKAKADLH